MRARNQVARRRVVRGRRFNSLAATGALLAQGAYGAGASERLSATLTGPAGA